MKNLYTFSLAAVSLLAAQHVSGQAFSFKERGWGFYVNAGLHSTSADTRFENLGFAGNFLKGETPGNDAEDDARPTARYANPGSQLYSFGIGGLGIASGIVFGGEINYYSSSNKDAALVNPQIATGVAGHNYTLSAQNYGADVMLKLGVIAYQSAGFVIYPTVGVGYGTFGTNLKDSRDNRYYPFYAGDGNNENRYVHNSNVVLDFALNPEYYVGSSEKDKAKGFKIGVSVGYRLQLANNNYMASFKSVSDDVYTKANISRSDMPKMGLNGFYAKLTIGLGKVYK